MLPFNQGFRGLLSCLLDAEVRFVVIGAHAVAFHGHVRATRGLDLWIAPDSENPRRTFEALKVFGAPPEGRSPEDLSDPGTILQIGLPPRRVDLLSEVEGVEFGEAWKRRQLLDLDGTSHRC